MKYYTRPKAGYQPDPADQWWEENKPAGVTVFEPEEQHIASGVLNAEGDMLFRAAMQPIGFIRFREES